MENVEEVKKKSKGKENRYRNSVTGPIGDGELVETRPWKGQIVEGWSKIE